MAQKGKKHQPGANKNKPVFVRGLKPSTKEWLDKQVNRDNPSVPKVVKRIVEEEHRRQTERANKD